MCADKRIEWHGFEDVGLALTMELSFECWTALRADNAVVMAADRMSEVKARGVPVQPAMRAALFAGPGTSRDVALKVFFDL